MGKGKRDKREGQRFVLAHRSRDDPALYTENASKFVFVKVPDGNAARTPASAASGAAAGTAGAATAPGAAAAAPGSRARVLGETLDEYGFPLDGYDYSKHLKPMLGGVFIGRDGDVSHGSGHVLPRGEAASTEPGDGTGAAAEEPAQAREVSLPASALPTDPEAAYPDAITTDESRMDRELRALLMDDDADEEGSVLGDLDDDFVTAAMGEGGEEEGDAPAFDFDAHVAELMRKAAAEDAAEGLGRGAAGGGLPAHPDDLEEFSSEEEDGEYGEEGDESEEEGAAPVAPAGAGVTKQQALLEARFAAMIGQYGDEEIGELEDPHVDPDMVGTTDLNEGNEELLDQLLDDTRQVPMAEAVSRVSKRLAEDAARREEAEAAGLPSNDNRARAAAGRTAKALARGKDPSKPAMEDQIPSSRAQREWDCETILTTLTNTDNLPTVIESDDDDEASVIGGRPGAERIRLSKKTGLPLGVLSGKGGRRGRRAPEDALPVADEEDDESEEEEDGDDEEEMERKARMSARAKGETVEEKRQRKQMVKGERRKQREKKKATKSMFKDELKKQKKDQHHRKQNVANKAVFRTS